MKSNTIFENRDNENISWLPLDNPSKIFLATMTSVDTKVFRLTASLKQPVQVNLLEKALEVAYRQFPIYHVIIRRGFFWYFVEHSNLSPQIEPEQKRFCAQIYHSSYRNLLFRVLYSYNRIELEVFHALSDGVGALQFFQTLLLAYFKFEAENQAKKQPQILPIYAGNQSLQDAFSLFDFGHKTTKLSRILTLKKSNQQKAGKVLHLKGKSTFDFRPNILELHYSTDEILAKARAVNGTITTYLAAVFSQALYLSANPKQRKTPCQVVISCPIDLRQHYAHLTARNFFATTLLSFTFPAESAGFEKSLPPIAEIVTDYNEQLQKASGKKKISQKVASLIHLEKIFTIRIIPLAVKDLILRLSNLISSRGISGSISNLGRFHLPDYLKDKLEDVVVATATIRPQMSIISFEQDLSICLTSALSSTDTQDKCREILADEGLHCTFAVESKMDNLSKGKIIKQTQERISSQQVPYPEVPIETKFSVANSVLKMITVLALAFYMLAKLWLDISLPLPILLLTLISLWLSTAGILRNRHNPAWLIVRQSLILGISIVGIDLLTHYDGWSLSWGLPAIIFGSLIANEIVLAVSKRARINGIYFQFTGIFLGFLPLLFIVLDWVQPTWPSLITATTSLILLILNLIFRHQKFREETEKKWHL